MTVRPEFGGDAKGPVARQSSGRWGSLWRRIRAPVARSTLVRDAAVSVLAGVVRFIAYSNPLAPGSDDPREGFLLHPNTIFALWHGQHLLSPVMNIPENPIVAMFSRSADAEINARVAERLGLRLVRGSGGRDREKSVEKGGARALIALKNALGSGLSVAMIADIAHGAPREAGLGIVTLARISGRPVVAFAVTSSRRKVVAGSWDKTTINLPFGRSAVVFGEPIHVPRDAGDDECEAKRREITASLNAATARAYQLADGVR